MTVPKRSMITVYGLKNCDRCRSAMKALKSAGLDARLVDLREGEISEADVGRWLEALGADHLVNRKSTTWRGLAAEARGRADGPEVARLLYEIPTLIKRPVVVTENGAILGALYSDDINRLADWSRRPDR